MGLCNPQSRGPGAANAVPWRQNWPWIYLLTYFYSSSSLSSLVFISVKVQPQKIILCSIGHIQNEVNYIKAQSSVKERIVSFPYYIDYLIEKTVFYFCFILLCFF